MEETFEKLKKHIANSTERKEEISKSSVGWQIDHSLKVILVICKSIKDSNPKDYKPKFSLIKSLIMLTGYMPRGKANAPKITKSEEVHFSEAFLLEKIEEAKAELASLEAYDENTFFPHPFFGHVNKANTVRFLEIHTNHHLKIIRDILK